MVPEVGVIISAAGLALLVLTSVGGLVWKLSRIEAALRAEYTEKISDVREANVREITALSAKLYQVEIWARDEFVRKASFESAIVRMEKGFGDLKTDIASRLDRMADRIDHIGHLDRERT